MGAVSFVQRFRSTLNAHVHFHCWVIDGVLVAVADGQVQFAEAAALRPEDLSAMQQQVRRRVLRWFARASHLDAADARDMASWDHGGGFSLDLRSASKAPTHRPGTAAALLRAAARCRWSASSTSARMRSSIASTSRSPMGVPNCG